MASFKEVARQRHAPPLYTPPSTLHPEVSVGAFTSVRAYRV